MGKHYKHLSRDDRVRMAALLGAGLSIRKTAGALGCHRATVYRELKRNCGPSPPSQYVAAEAQDRATDRWRASHRRERIRSLELRAYIRRKLKKRWSPEQIAGRLRCEGQPVRVSHETIYQWVYQVEPGLIGCLWRAHPKRLGRRYRKQNHSRIPARVPLQERPAEVATRAEAGHWEVDTASWRNINAGLLVTAERKTRSTRLRKIPGRQARALSRKLVAALRCMPRKMRKTMTYDNGPENIQHVWVNRKLGTRSYFCDPYASWQKATVENTVGLVRRYLPRSRDFRTVTDEEVRRIERLLNNLPRKCLGFRTPAEAFRAECRT